MTNKPMLSVERDLIERAVQAIINTSQMQPALNELRALLDKPAEPSKFVGAAQYWSENEQALRDVCRFEGLKGLVYQVVRDRDKPAAQHQGEVAQLHEEIERLRIRGQNCSNKVATLRAQMAEQPAPVAVDAEILERFPEINFANYGQDEVEALQAWAFEAYEAIARLNGVKP